MNTKYKTIYRIDIAMELIKRGHKIASTAPNPQRNDYTMWIFEIDETFYSDFNELLKSRKE